MVTSQACMPSRSLLGLPADFHDVTVRIAELHAHVVGLVPPIHDLEPVGLDAVAKRAHVLRAVCAAAEVEERREHDGLVDLSDREREPVCVVEDGDAILARLGLRHEAEVPLVEAHRARLVRDGEGEVGHYRARAPTSPGRTSRGGATSPASCTGGFSGSSRGSAPKEARKRSSGGSPYVVVRWRGTRPADRIKASIRSGGSSCPNSAPAEREIDSFINVPPRSLTPAASACRVPSGPSFTHDAWMFTISGCKASRATAWTSS